MTKRSRKPAAKVATRATLGQVALAAYQAGARAASKQPPQAARRDARPVLLAAGAVLVAFLAIKEYPALRREIKIWMM